MGCCSQVLRGLPTRRVDVEDGPHTPEIMHTLQRVIRESRQRAPTILAG